MSSFNTAQQYGSGFQFASSKEKDKDLPKPIVRSLLLTLSRSTPYYDPVYPDPHAVTRRFTAWDQLNRRYRGGESAEPIAPPQRKRRFTDASQRPGFVSSIESFFH
ncbi:uncharacterized protein UTRI_03981 [Ustilago trichophora]|uniref:Uncharacterized protein n=1 Tax=Ustilago trichophora TaxID=86804 RepID=A0A5C3E7B4_9BASI|nr:uncharacterized protein UTRI_03981 [Ustilago trichophora]